MRKDIREGSVFPDYELPDQDGMMQKLSELQGANPMVLVLSRGYFCPKDRQQMRRLVPFWDECQVSYTGLVTITTDNRMQLNGFRQGVGAYWPFLYDEKKVIQKDLEIQEYTDPYHDPMIPYTFVLEPELKIFRIYNGYWYWGRPSVEELKIDLRNVMRKIRPDWQIDTPELRKAWENGNKNLFFPYQE